MNNSGKESEAEVLSLTTTMCGIYKGSGLAIKDGGDFLVIIYLKYYLNADKQVYSTSTLVAYIFPKKNSGDHS